MGETKDREAAARVSAKREARVVAQKIQVLHERLSAASRDCPFWGDRGDGTSGPCSECMACIVRDEFGSEPIPDTHRAYCPGAPDGQNAVHDWRAGRCVACGATTGRDEETRARVGVFEKVDRTHPYTPPVDAGVREWAKRFVDRYRSAAEFPSATVALDRVLAEVGPPPSEPATCSHGATLDRARHCMVCLSPPPARLVHAAAIAQCAALCDGYAGDSATAARLAEAIRALGPPPSSETSEEHDERLREEGREQQRAEREDHHHKVARSRRAWIDAIVSALRLPTEWNGGPEDVAAAVASLLTASSETSERAAAEVRIAAQREWRLGLAKLLPVGGDDETAEEALTLALARARAEAIEECVAVLLHRKSCQPDGYHAARIQLDMCIEGIRALASPLPRVEAEPLNHAAGCPRHDGLRCTCPKGDERPATPEQPTARVEAEPVQATSEMTPRDHQWRIAMLARAEPDLPVPSVIFQASLPDRERAATPEQPIGGLATRSPLTRSTGR